MIDRRCWSVSRLTLIVPSLTAKRPLIPVVVQFSTAVSIETLKTYNLCVQLAVVNEFASGSINATQNDTRSPAMFRLVSSGGARNFYLGRYRPEGPSLGSLQGQSSGAHGHAA